jgi:hypothetical protein
MIRPATAIALTLVASLASLEAQDPADTIAFSPMNIEFMSGPIAFDTEPVAGAPYSAEAVTDVVQTLADGNRIVRQSKAQIARDSRGRTRREQGLGTFGPLVNSFSNGSRHVQISDPETKTTIMLDLEHKIAHQMPAPHFKMAGGVAAIGTASAGEKVEWTMAAPAPPPGAEGAAIKVFNFRREIAAEQAGRPTVEQLGVQFMEGVTVEGTRTTATLPAGQIGNEQPINIVSERWFSPDLKVLVMSRQSDPRFGETTYRLTNINRSEPAAELFQVPSDFKVVNPENVRDVIIEKRIQNR